MMLGSSDWSLQRVPRNFLIVALFLQGWILLLHFILAEHGDPTVRVLGRSCEFNVPTTRKAAPEIIKA